MTYRLALSALVALGWVGMTAGPAAGQNLDLFDQGGQEQGSPGFDDPIVTARLSPASAQPGEEVTLSVTVTLPPEHYTYPTDPSFGQPTRILVQDAVGLEPVEERFRADHPPKVVNDEFVGRIEKYTDEVTWSRKYRIEPDAKLEEVSVIGELDYQVCDANRCTPMRTAFQAFLDDNQTTTEAADTKADPALVHPFTFEERPTILNKPSPGVVRAKLAPKNAQPGDEVTLRVTVELDDGWHVYGTEQKKVPGALPTTLRLVKSAGLVPIGSEFQSSEPPLSKTLNLTGEPQEFLLHEGTVTWTRQFQVQPSAEMGQYGLEGAIRYLTCTDKRCLRPLTVSFALGNLNNAGDVPAPIAADEAAEKSDTAQSAAATGDLPLYLMYAFLGGLILNVMPCVLPVIAIKAMSFVQQAGESRGRIFVLNFVYALGVISVFLLLASLAAFPQILGERLGWGGLFQKTEFNLVMGALVFAMGLSLLGVFEIPVPGFVGSQAAQQQQEGLSGAFLTGILATVLATPCSGPFLGITLGWSVQQPPQVTYLVWGTMGVGMAFPYLVFGLFPAALKWLPKPGNWMVRFKELSGFVLMGTTLWILRNLDEAVLIGVLVMLLGLALALWMLGNLSTHNTPGWKKWLVRLSGADIVLLSAAGGSHLIPETQSKGLIASLQNPLLLAGSMYVLGLLLAGWIIRSGMTDGASTFRRWATATLGCVMLLLSAGGGYAVLMGGSELPWQPFSEDRLTSMLAQKRTVLVDFTADW